LKCTPTFKKKKATMEKKNGSNHQLAEAQRVGKQKQSTIGRLQIHPTDNRRKFYQLLTRHEQKKKVHLQNVPSGGGDTPKPSEVDTTSVSFGPWPWLKRGGKKAVASRTRINSQVHRGARTDR